MLLAVRSRCQARSECWNIDEAEGGEDDRSGTRIQRSSWVVVELIFLPCKGLARIRPYSKSSRTNKAARDGAPGERLHVA